MRGVAERTVGMSDTSQAARPAPSAPPIAATRNPSRMTVPMARARDAPRAARIASSRARRWTWTRVSPAMLATAMIHSDATAPKTSISPRRELAIRDSLNDRTSADHPASVLGNSFASASWIVASSRPAASTLTPGRSRPMPLMNRASRTPMSQGFVCAGSHTSVAALVKVPGMTPTISYDRPPMTSARPTAAGARSKRRVQNRSLIIAAPGPFASSSSSVNQRPASGRIA